MSGNRDLGEVLEEYLIDGTNAGDLDPALARVAGSLKMEWNRELAQSVTPPAVRTTKSHSRLNRIQVYVGLAAAILVALVGIEYVPGKKAVVKSYTTAPGQRATVTLADGSQVILAPATALKVQNRTVELEGEALFTVTGRSEEPFTVKTGNYTTRVLGTTFSVRSYQNEGLYVAVAEGRVMVDNSVLANGDIATVAAGGAVNVSHDAERVADMLAFARGKLVLDVQTLADAAPQIARWYGLNIKVDSSAAGQRIGITLEKEAPSAALDIIAELTHTTYRMDGRVVTFSLRNPSL